MAIVILGALTLGLYCSYLTRDSEERQFLLDILKSLGMTALALIILRIPVRVALGEPDWRARPARSIRTRSHVAPGVL